MLDMFFTVLAGRWWILQIFVVVLITVVINAVQHIIFKRLHLACLKTNNNWDDVLFSAMDKPLGVLIWLLGITFAIDIIRFSSDKPTVLFQSTSLIREVGVILLVAWFLLRMIKALEKRWSGEGERETTWDKTTARAAAQLLRLTVIITAGLVTLQILGIPITGVLAFGGVGGVAVGFAARDLLANFFGGIMIFLDRPFSVGDWVRSPDRDIEGFVEHIGWRLTRIRRFDKRPLYVPNSLFLTICVENPSRMTNRRIRQNIGIRYEDADKMDAILFDIEAMLQNHPEIDTNQLLMVKFVEFGPSSLDFMIYTFTKTINWKKFLTVQEDVFLKSLEIIAKHGAECAFTTTTLHIPEAIHKI